MKILAKCYTVKVKSPIENHQFSIGEVNLYEYFTINLINFQILVSKKKWHGPNMLGNYKSFSHVTRYHLVSLNELQRFRIHNHLLMGQ